MDPLSTNPNSASFPTKKRMGEKHKRIEKLQDGTIDPTKVINNFINYKKELLKNESEEFLEYWGNRKIEIKSEFNAFTEVLEAISPNPMIAEHLTQAHLVTIEAGNTQKALSLIIETQENLIKNQIKEESDHDLPLENFGEKVTEDPLPQISSQATLNVDPSKTMDSLATNPISENYPTKKPMAEKHERFEKLKSGTIDPTKVINNFVNYQQGHYVNECKEYLEGLEDHKNKITSEFNTFIVEVKAISPNPIISDHLTQAHLVTVEAENIQKEFLQIIENQENLLQNQINEDGELHLPLQEFGQKVTEDPVPQISSEATLSAGNIISNFLSKT